jgi:hypothetical protein
MKTLEHISRAICAADGFGPDETVMQYVPTVGALGRPVVHGDLLPQWQVYQPVAMAVLTTLIDYGPSDGEEFRTYVADVLRGAAEMPPNPPSDETINQNWRVFYGLKR